LPVSSGDAAPSFTWGRSSAHLAQILFQPPVRLAVHGSRMLAGMFAAAAGG